MDLEPLVAKLDALAKNLVAAVSVRDRVRISDGIFSTLSEIEQQVERFVIMEIGQAGREGMNPSPIKAQGGVAAPSGAKGVRFRNTTFIEASLVLLKEHGILHGKELENLLKANGYRSKAKHFQSIVRTSLSKDERFKAIGGNRWKLKEPGEQAHPESAQDEEEHHAARNGSTAA